MRLKLSVVALRFGAERTELPAPRARASTSQDPNLSRSFGQPVSDRRELQEAITTFTARAACKLRREKFAAGAISIFAHSSRFKEPYYSQSAKCDLWTATNHTPTLLQYAMPLVEKVWKEGVEFKKAGILLTRITEEGVLQLSLFENYDPGDSKPKQLMLAIDGLNRRYQHDTVRFAVMGFKLRWQTRAQFRSNRWTTRWDELMVVKA